MDFFFSDVTLSVMSSLNAVETRGKEKREKKKKCVRTTRRVVVLTNFSTNKQ